MEGAVLAFLDARFGKDGTLRNGLGPWKDNAKIKAAMQRPSDTVVAIVIDFLSKIYDRYGRYPIRTGPLATTTAFQAHHLDREYYEKFYATDLGKPQDDTAAPGAAQAAP